MPADLKERIKELEAANERLSRLGRAVERERDEALARLEKLEADIDAAIMETTDAR